MDQVHKDLIEKNAQALQKLINLEALLPHLQDDQTLFPEEWMSIFENSNIPIDKRTEQLLKSLTKRGPKAFNDFTNRLRRAGQWDALRLLVAGASYDGEGDCTDGNTNTRSSNTNVLQFGVHKATVPYGGRVFDPKKMYKMESSPRGLALIINNIKFDNEIAHETRLGANVDESGMKGLLDDLGFIVVPYQNLTVGEMTNALFKFAEDPRHENADCCIVCIMSHGNRYGFFGKDGFVLHYDHVHLMFNHQGCPLLKGKPKLFFFQGCRGDLNHIGVPTSGRVRTDSGGFQPAALPDLSPAFGDIFILYSTVEGYVSMRDDVTGTWFISAVVSVFKKRACDLDFFSLVFEVQDELSQLTSTEGHKQSAQTQQILPYKPKLYFNPGYCK